MNLLVHLVAVFCIGCIVWSVFTLIYNKDTKAAYSYMWRKLKESGATSTGNKYEEEE